MLFAGHINVIRGPDVGQACCKPIFGLVIVDFLLVRGQFHQPYGAKRKCVGSHSVSPTKIRPTFPVCMARK